MKKSRNILDDLAVSDMSSGNSETQELHDASRINLF